VKNVESPLFPCVSVAVLTFAQGIMNDANLVGKLFAKKVSAELKREGFSKNTIVNLVRRKKARAKSKTSQDTYPINKIP
jgi:hypothetical protein